MKPLTKWAQSAGTGIQSAVDMFDFETAKTVSKSEQVMGLGRVFA